MRSVIAGFKSEGERARRQASRQETAENLQAAGSRSAASLAPVRFHRRRARVCSAGSPRRRRPRPVRRPRPSGKEFERWKAKQSASSQADVSAPSQRQL